MRGSVQFMPLVKVPPMGVSSVQPSATAQQPPTSFLDRTKNVCRNLFGSPEEGDIESLLHQEEIKRVRIFKSQYTLLEPLPQKKAIEETTTTPPPSPSSPLSSSSMSPQPPLSSSSTTAVPKTDERKIQIELQTALHEESSAWKRQKFEEMCNLEVEDAELEIDKDNSKRMQQKAETTPRPSQRNSSAKSQQRTETKTDEGRPNKSYDSQNQCMTRKRRASVLTVDIQEKSCPDN